MASSGGRSSLDNIRRIARQYLKSKIGMLGLIIIVFFILMAVLAPSIATNDPISGIVASPFDIPAWATVLPWYNHLAVDATPVSSTFVSQADINAWSWSGQNYTKSLSTAIPTGQTQYKGSVLVTSLMNESTEIQTSDANLPGGVVAFSMSRPFQFSGVSPTGFEAQVALDPAVMNNVSMVYVKMEITDPTGDNFSLASISPPSLDQQVAIPNGQNGTWRTVYVSAGLLPLANIEAYQVPSPPSKVIFNESGTYSFSVQIQAVPEAGATLSSLSVNIASVSLHLDGSAYGLLGTDNFGRDVWSQFVWGSQVSLVIGILSGVGAVGMGAAIGIAGGYIGGSTDNIIGRITDFVLVLPFLPLLLIIATLLVGNRALYSQIYIFIILIFVVLSWPTIAKIVRSQVLSVKERQYVEASRALGAGTGHILRRHILPNVMGLVYSQVALNVAGFILLEAALDFLAISTHGVRTMTWGLMLTYALPFAVHQSNLSYVWWWFFPPGISIAALSLAFVLVGYALDSIFNPRLRAR